MEQNKVQPLEIIPRPEKKARLGEDEERELEVPPPVLVDDSDEELWDDSDEESWDRPPLKELGDRYKKERKESQGYDISYCPRAQVPMIQPVCFEYDPHKCHPLKIKVLDELATDIDSYAKLATECYNKQKNAQLQFLKVIKVNQSMMFTSFYITFEAKDGADGDAKICQANVITLIGGDEPRVREVRLKPESNFEKVT